MNRGHVSGQSVPQNVTGGTAETALQVTAVFARSRARRVARRRSAFVMITVVMELAGARCAQKRGNPGASAPLLSSRPLEQLELLAQAQLR